MSGHVLSTCFEPFGYKKVDIQGSQWDPRKTGNVGPYQDHRKTGTRDFSVTLAGPSGLGRLRTGSLHKFHKCISFTSQIVRLTANSLSNFALHRGFFFLHLSWFFGLLCLKEASMSDCFQNNILASGASSSFPSK